MHAFFIVQTSTEREKASAHRSLMCHLRSGAEIEALAASQCKTNFPPDDISTFVSVPCARCIVLCQSVLLLCT